MPRLEQGRPPWPGQVDGDRLDIYLQHVGRANELLLRERELLREIMMMLAGGLRDGSLPQQHVGMIASFLERIASTRDQKTSLAVLGRTDLIRPGAPSKDEEVRWWEAREVYEWLIDTGSTEEEALRQAWESWVYDPFAEKQRTYEEESRRPAGEGKTAYQQQIEMLKSRLNRAGSRTPAKRGRKPKIIDP